jgi:hypothetical protein
MNYLENYSTLHYKVKVRYGKVIPIQAVEALRVARG